MARFRTGAEAIKQAAESRGSSKDFAPQITWRGGETKYVQFITRLEDVPTVEMYQYIVVGHKQNGDPIYRTFISPRDPGLLAENPDARDYLRERGLFARRRQVALAVELEPQIETVRGKRKPVGFSVAQRTYENQDGSEKIVPAVGIIIQSHLFFGWFATFAEDYDVEDHVFKVTRRGNDQNTTYDCFEVGKAIELSLNKEDLPIDFDEYLDELSSEERMRELVADKPKDWVFDRYANRGKAKSQPRARHIEEEEETPEEDPGASKRRSRFAELRESVGAEEKK